MPSPVLMPPFLLGSAPSESLRQEQALLHSLAQAETADAFVLADRLQELYRRHFRSGGLKGSSWLSEFRRGTAAKVEEQNLYPAFLRRNETGTVLALPSDIVPPVGFRFSQEIGRPAVIALETSRTVFCQRPFYFSLSELFFEEAGVLPSAVAEAREGLAKGKKLGAAVVRHHRSGTPLVRSDAALCKALHDDGFPYVLGRVTGLDAFGEPSFRISDLREEEPPARVLPRLSAIPPAPFTLNFAPRRDLAFPPRSVTLVRRGEPYPVVIEQQDFDGLMTLAGSREREALLIRRGKAALEGARSFLLAVRSPVGDLDGYCINHLASDGASLLCEHAFKLDRDKVTGIRYFGLALTIARLLFLKEIGRWPERGPVLFNFIPAVSSSYRSLLGLAGGIQGHEASMDAIEREEAEIFLQRNPFHFERLGYRPTQK